MPQSRKTQINLYYDLKDKNENPNNIKKLKNIQEKNNNNHNKYLVENLVLFTEIICLLNSNIILKKSNFRHLKIQWDIIIILKYVYKKNNNTIYKTDFLNCTSAVTFYKHYSYKTLVIYLKIMY